MATPMNETHHADSRLGTCSRRQGGKACGVDTLHKQHLQPHTLPHNRSRGQALGAKDHVGPHCSQHFGWLTPGRRAVQAPQNIAHTFYNMRA